MTSPAALFNDALALGCVFTLLEPDNLHVAAPKGVLTSSMVDNLRRYKPNLRQLILLRPKPVASIVAPPAIDASRLMVCSMSRVISGPPHRRSRLSNPETLRLLQWFRETAPDLPREPFRLAAWLYVTDPVKFFERLRAEADRFPYGDRPDGLISDLARLKSIVDARQGESGGA